MKNNTRLTLTSYIFFFLVGFFINIGGAVTSALAQSLATGTAVIGYCFSAFMIGRFFGISGNGLLLKKEKLNKNIYVRLASIISLATVFFLQFASNTWILAMCLFVAGIGIGLQYSISNLIIVDVHTGKRRAFHISIINFLYSAGSIASPFLAGLLLKRGLPWISTYVGYALLLVLALIVLIRTDYNTLFQTDQGKATDSGKLTRDHALVCAALVLYILAEFSITFWTPVYMREALGKDALFAGTCVSTFWIAILTGRILTSILLKHIKARTFILTSGVFAFASLLVLRLVSADSLVLLVMFTSGIFCAGLFPAIFTFGTDIAESLKRTFPTLMMLSAATGSFLAMPTGSIVKSLVGVAWMPLVPAIAIALMYIIISFTAKKRT